MHGSRNGRRDGDNPPGLGRDHLVFEAVAFFLARIVEFLPTFRALDGLFRSVNQKRLGFLLCDPDGAFYTQNTAGQRLDPGEAPADCCLINAI